MDFDFLNQCLTIVISDDRRTFVATMELTYYLNLLVQNVLFRTLGHYIYMPDELVITIAIKSVKITKKNLVSVRHLR